MKEDTCALSDKKVAQMMRNKVGKGGRLSMSVSVAAGGSKPMKGVLQ
jgi:hypothetical protein